MQRWGHLPISSRLTIRDAYERRAEAGMVNLEEGVVRHWSWGGRVVLVGDAAHKFTPSTGAGCNNGIVDIIVLINQLRAEVHGACGAPSESAIASAFRRYQDLRFDAVTAGCASAGLATAAALDVIPRLSRSSDLRPFSLPRRAPSKV